MSSEAAASANTADPSAPFLPGDSSLARFIAGTTARLLVACAHSAGGLGLACAALAALALLARLPATAAPAPALLLTGVLLLTPVERVLALRLHFDAGLFRDLARAGAASPTTLGALDQSLHRLRLRAPSSHLRSLSQRVRGARRLLGWHVATVVGQFIGVLLPALGAVAGGGT